MNADLRASVLEVVGDKQVADQPHSGQGFISLSDQHAVVFGFGMADVDGHQLSTRRLEIRLEEEDRSVISNERILVVKARHQVDGHSVGFGQVLVEDPVLVVGPLPDGQYQVPAVLCHLGAEAPVGVVRPLVDQHVVALWRAHTMVIDLLVEVEVLELGSFGRFVEPAVEEAAVVVGPGDAAELDPLEFVVELAA